MRMIVSQLWDGRRRVEGREGDQGPLGKERSRRRETKRGGRVGMWPRQRRETESNRAKSVTALCPYWRKEK